MSIRALRGTSAHARRRAQHQGGFSLVELMTVVAIIGVATTLGVVYLDKDNKAETVKLFSEQLGAKFEVARARAVASQHRQQLIIDPQGFSLFQYVNPGLATIADPLLPANWDFVSRGRVPNTDIRVDGVAAALAFAPGGPLPYLGTVAGGWEIDVLPDGRARTSLGHGVAESTNFFEPGWTVYVTDANNKQQYRILLMAVTGTSVVYQGW